MLYESLFTPSNSPGLSSEARQRPAEGKKKVDLVEVLITMAFVISLGLGFSPFFVFFLPKPDPLPSSSSSTQSIISPTVATR
jgi:hypothetical protein